MLKSMLFLKFNLKRFSQFAKISLVNDLKNVKNCIYFTTHDEVKDNKNNVTNNIKTTSPNMYNDIKNQQLSIVYPYSHDSFFTERMFIVNAPNDSEKLRSLSCSAIRQFYKFKPEDVHVLFSDLFPLHQREVAISSIILSNYKFKKYGTVVEPEKIDENFNFIKQINIYRDNLIINNEDSIKLSINLANATLYTRSLANERANIATCDYLEEIARDLIKNRNNTSIEVIKGDELIKNDLNLIHAVGKSAESAPRLVILTYKGDKSNKIFSHAIVGKGLTFDTGGLNLKPTNHIEDMYLDKHGACNVLAIFKNIVDMQLPINLICAMGLAENSIDSSSYKPSDIIKSHKGYTVEITNTDAEGRLVLCDVLSYVQDKYSPENIVDLATLTGACMVALGNKTAGLFTNKYGSLAEGLIKASKEVFEPLWHLPINDEHRKDMKSHFADLKNAGKDRYGGASKGAAFLEYFINKDTNWVHLDIAGPSSSSSQGVCVSEGATGYGTQLVLKYLYNHINTNNKSKDEKTIDNNYQADVDEKDTIVSSNSENATKINDSTINLEIEK